MRDFGRRRFLSLAAALAPVGLSESTAAWTAAQPRAIDLESFHALSGRLTGRHPLDRELARTYLSALLTVPGNAEGLAQLARGELAVGGRTKALVDLEQEIVEAWYTGIYRINGSNQLATHGRALMWAALSRPAPGVCASATGAWAKPRTKPR